MMTNEKKPHKNKNVNYAVLELGGGGELFDFISETGKFEDNFCRFFFEQMLAALNSMHNSNVCHRDMKPDNIMLDNSFNIKIADFGFAAPAKGRDGGGYLQTQLGTRSYMAPEIHLAKPYSGPGVDFFAAGIILFIMKVGRPPFGQADPYKDEHYKMIAAKRFDLFW